MAAVGDGERQHFDPESYTWPQFQQECGPQLQRAGVPVLYWRTLYEKLRYQVFDAGVSFGFSPIVEDDLTGPMSLAAAAALAQEDPTNAWIVDHAWTFQAASAAVNLRADDALRHRVAAMLIGEGASTMHASYVDWIIQEVLDNLWKRARNYRLDASGATVWYLADEVGTAVLPTVDGAEANVAFAAVYFPPLQTAFDVMWPIRDIEPGDGITHDVARGMPDHVRNGHPKFALVWAGGDEEEEVQGICLAKYLMHCDVVREREAVAEARLHAVATGGLQPADLLLAAHGPARPALTSAVVFCDDAEIRRQLERGDKYAFTDAMDEADVVWIKRPLPAGSNISTLAPRCKFVSQFNNEASHISNELSRSRSVSVQLGEPAWQPVTFAATTEMDLFVGRHQFQQHHSPRPSWALDQLKPAWCVRPQGKKIGFVTTNLDLLLRAGEEGSDQATISQFVRQCDTLPDGRKYSLQFFVLAHSFAPLKVFTLRRYWVRASQQPLALDNDERDLLDPAVHLTRGNVDMMHPDVFEAIFDDLHGPGRWQFHVANIHNCLFDLFAAIELQAGSALAGGAGPIKTCCAGALYRVEVVLERIMREEGGVVDLQPRIVSVDTCPDTSRQNAEDPRFYGSVFDALFCGVPDAGVAVRLTGRTVTHGDDQRKSGAATTVD